LAPTVLVNAGPWLRVPPAGYGGIENVLATLVPELRRRGARVVLAGVAGSALAVDRLLPTVAEPMFGHLTAPYNRVSGIAHAHMAAVVQALRETPVDLVHDHLEVVGPSVLAAMGRDAPPVLHTLHWDLRKHPEFYARFPGGPRLAVNAVSRAQLALAPAALRAHALGAVPLAVDVGAIPYAPAKGDRLLVLARITEAKGQDVAVRLAAEHGWALDLAGPVAGAGSPAALAEVDAALPDVRFFHRAVAPRLDGERIRWLGALDGPAKLAALGRARALLCPVRWDEPGATAALEALACGTPVIALRRGAYPEVLEEGRTGLLADDEAGLARAVELAGELDPAACRAAAEARFDAPRMAEAYLRLYAELLTRAAA